MGASFNTRGYDGSLTKEQVKQKFAADQEQCRHENGHSYSGGIGMADGLEFDDTKTFDDWMAANTYLQERAQKWEAAIAVKIKATAEKPASWFVGAWCSS